MANEGRGFGGAFLFLTGAAVGGALGVLLAPRSGHQTREKLADWLKDRRERGEELLHTVKDESLAKKEAILAAAKAAKQAYTETTKHVHS